ncbi:hypothetical protein ACFC0C_26515 [Streptomyces sp. NPDC056178]|uniref:hypothetical protein n=1 Tax=unclassified Streptomyces TaxID=2593676 RepID=UPI0035D61CE2
MDVWTEVQQGQELNRKLIFLGYTPGKDDKIVHAVQEELSHFARSPQSAMSLWGWDVAALEPEDSYRLEQILRMYVFQRGQVAKALERLEKSIMNAPNVARCYRELEDFQKFLGKEAERCVAAEVPLGEDLHRRWLETFSTDFPVVAGVIAFQHSAVARSMGKVQSLDMGVKAKGGVYWRLTGRGYPREWIEYDFLYDEIDTALALQAELQLQCLLTDREFARLVSARGQKFAYLLEQSAIRAARDAARNAAIGATGDSGSSFWSELGGVLGIVSAVAGALALIPVLTPIAGPVAAVTAIGALGAHAVDASIKGDWDAATIVGLDADAFAALPALGAVAKSMKAGTAVLKTVGAGSKAAYRARVAVRRAGLTFLAETGGAEASNASKVFDYIGAKGAKIVRLSEQSGKIAGKVLQGSVNLSTQVPLVVEMASGQDMTQPKNAAGGTALTANLGRSTGSWGPVGTAAQKADTTSLATFSKIIGRR